MVNHENVTSCAGPSTARPHNKVGGLAGLLIRSWLANGFLTFAAIAAILGLTFTTPLAWCGIAIATIGALKDFKRWYYHERLLCIQNQQCAIGTVAAPTGPPATDGDTKLNLLLAPYTRKECEDILLNHLTKNRGMLSDPNHTIWHGWFGGRSMALDDAGNYIYIQRTGNGSEELDVFISTNPDGERIYVYEDGTELPPGLGELLPNKYVRTPPPTDIDQQLANARNPTPGQSSREILQRYMRRVKGINTDVANAALESNAFNQITLGVVDTLLDDNKSHFNDRIFTDDTRTTLKIEKMNYQQHFWRKDSTKITDVATWDSIPVDYPPADPAFTWQDADAHSTFTQTNPQTGEPNENLNPIFRFGDIDEDGKTKINVGVIPYLHCEINGNAIEITLDRWIVSFTVFVVACFIGGPIIALALAALIWLLKWLYDKVTNNTGNADMPGPIWDDPEAGTHESGEAGPDVVAVWGDWIMDTEHQQYFEIHPVRAYYILGRHEEGDFPDYAGKRNHDNVDSRIHGYPVEQITKTVRDHVCEHMHASEPRRTPGGLAVVYPATALSFGLFTQYG